MLLFLVGMMSLQDLVALLLLLLGGVGAKCARCLIVGLLDPAPGLAVPGLFPSRDPSPIVVICWI